MLSALTFSSLQNMQSGNILLGNSNTNLWGTHDEACKYLTRDIGTQIDRRQFVYLFPHFRAKTSDLHVTSSLSTLTIEP